MRLPQLAWREVLCNTTCESGCLGYRRSLEIGTTFYFATGLLLYRERPSQDACGDQQRTILAIKILETPAFFPQAAAQPTDNPAAVSHRNCA